MLDLHVTDDDGFDEVVTVRPRQLLVFERLTGIPFSRMEEDGISLTQLYQLAHLAMRAHHPDRAPAKLKEFELRFDVMPAAGEDGGALGPGRAAA